LANENKQLNQSQIEEIKYLLKDLENLPTIKSKVETWKKQGFNIEELESVLLPIYENTPSNTKNKLSNFDKFLIFTGIFFFTFFPIGRFLFIDTNIFYYDRILWIIIENIVGLSLCAYPFFKSVNKIKIGLLLSIGGYLIGLLSFLVISGLTHTFLRIASTVLIIFIIQNVAKFKN